MVKDVEKYSSSGELEFDPEALTRAVRDLREVRSIMERHFTRIWAQRHLRTETGGPLDFTDRPWLRQIWDDTTPQIAIQKCAQVGATTWGYCTAFHRAVALSQTVIYTMPTAGDIASFVSGRLNKAIDSSPLLSTLIGREGKRLTQARTTPRDNIGLKQFGTGAIYLRGTVTSRSAVSVPAHCLIHDEVDLSVPEILELYQHRLDRLPPSEWQIYSISTPTVDGYGINARYRDSSSYVWLARCRSCGWEGELSYWDHTRGNLEQLTCTECSAQLDPRMGSFVAQHPDLVGVRHGYKISRLMTVLPDMEGSALLRALHERRRNARYERHFMNMDLGETSSEGAARVTREDLLAVCFMEPYLLPPKALWRAESGTGPYFMGVDQGNVLNVLIGRCDPRLDDGKIRIVLAARISDPDKAMGPWKEGTKDGTPGLAALMRLYNIRLCVVDGGPDGAAAHELAKQFPGRVLVCYYGNNQKAEVVESADVRRASQGTLTGRGALRMKVDATTRVDLTVDRTESLSNTAADLKQGLFMLPGPPPPHIHPEIEELMRQVENNVMRPIEDKQGVTIYRWDKTGPDHYFHTLNYLRVAVEEGKRLAQLRPAIRMPLSVSIVPGR